MVLWVSPLLHSTAGEGIAEPRRGSCQRSNLSSCFVRKPKAVDGGARSTSNRIKINVKGDGQECPSHRKGIRGLALHEFAKHLFGVDGDEGASAAGQDFVFLVTNFSGVDVLAALNADSPALDMQRLVQGDGL